MKGFEQRAELDEQYDLLVIGGGIVGSGVARDAATRGLKVLLVEQADFASGTSSRSSRLLHGGIRYLAQGRIGLVREASLEKMRLSQIAPHLCQPLPFLFPSWKGSGLPLWQLAIGVRIYDWLSGGRNLGRSSSLKPTAVIEKLPGLKPEGLRGASRHYDALTNDARLVIDTLLAAAQAGATVRNYTHFLNAERSGDVWNCQLKDTVLDSESTVHASAIVNAAGAWAASFDQSKIRLRLTKGIHLVVDRQKLPVDEAVVLTEGERFLFVIPWGERVILGTTDTDYTGDPAKVQTDPADREYVLQVVNTAFPKAELQDEDVLTTWAGIRPLIAPASDATGSPSDISRKHVISMAQPGWIDVAGGKLTTYRLMAEQTVDQVGRFLQRSLPRSSTATEPLPYRSHSGVIPPAVDQQVVEQCCRHEWAVHLDDLLLRRTSWHYYFSAQENLVQQAAEWMGNCLNWTPEQTAQELERFAELPG